MKFLKKLLRTIVLVLFIVLASIGLGLFNLNPRSPYMHKENNIELVEKKEDEDTEKEQKDKQ